MIAAAPSQALTIRPAHADDQAFVAATFAEQLQRGHHQDANAVVDRVLDSSLTRVLVATDGGRIVGWLAYAAIPRVRAVLFMYVRRQSRLQGVARELVDAAWPARTGAWVHGGLRGGRIALLDDHGRTIVDAYGNADKFDIIGRYGAVKMSIEELL